jgi:hypothetical protein
LRLVEDLDLVDFDLGGGTVAQAISKARCKTRCAWPTVRAARGLPVPAAGLEQRRVPRRNIDRPEPLQRDGAKVRDDLIFG